MYIEPPNCKLSDTKKLLKFLYDQIDKKSNIIICGDFNITNINWPEYKLTNKKCPFANLFLEFLDQKQIKQLVTEPTREKSFLDLVLTTNPNMINAISVGENFSTSDHKMIQFNILEQFEGLKRSKKYRRDFKKSNFSTLNHAILQYRLDALITTEYSVEEKYNLFTSELYRLFDAFLPLKPINKIIKKSYPSNIRRLSSEKFRLHKLSKQFPNSENIKLNLKIVSLQLKRKLKIYHEEKEKYQISMGKSSIYNL